MLSPHDVARIHWIWRTVGHNSEFEEFLQRARLVIPDNGCGGLVLVSDEKEAALWWVFVAVDKYRHFSPRRLKILAAVCGALGAKWVAGYNRNPKHNRWYAAAGFQQIDDYTFAVRVGTHNGTDDNTRHIRN